MTRSSLSSEHGFSLVESLVACALLVTGLLSLAQLFGLAGTLVVATRHATLGTVLAAQKIEELRTRASGPEDGVELLDGRGQVIPAGAGMASGTAAYVRRWSVQLLPRDPNVVVIEVLVAPAGAAAAVLSRGSGDPPPSGVRLVAAWRRPV